MVEEYIDRYFLKGNHFNRAIESKMEAVGSILYKSQAIGGLIEPAMSFVSYITYAAVLITAGLLSPKDRTLIEYTHLV